jgi:hypothetical protein
MIDEAKKARDEALSVGDEIWKFAYSKDHDFMYGANVDPNVTWKAKVCKTAEYLETIGPALYQTNPDRRVNAKDWATPVQKQRSMVMQDYLNFIPKECNLSGHSRKGINDALIYCAGVVWTGYNPKKKCIQSVHDSIKNLLMDPTAKSMEELQWVGRERCKPLWQVIDRYPKAKQELANYQGADYAGSTGKVKYYEIYTLVGLHHFNGGQSAQRDEDGIPYTSDEPRKYVITDDGKVLDETEWEIPFHKDDKWPFSLLGFRYKPDCIWPVSPLETGLPFQKAINFGYTFIMEKMRNACKDVIAFAKVMGDSLTPADKKRIQHGFGTIMAEFETTGDAGTKIGDLVQQWTFATNLKDIMDIITVLENQFAHMTGLTELVAIGTTENQFRSAAEANLKDKNARTRFEDMRMQVEAWQTEIARHEAQAARFLLEPEDIKPILGPQAAQLWGQLMPPQAQLEQDLMMQAQQSGIPPETAAPMIQMQIQQMQQAGVIYDEWLLEADYTIEAGSTRRQDISQQIDASNEFIRQVLPVIMGPAAANPMLLQTVFQTLGSWAKINQMPVEMQQALLNATQAALIPPPMPMPPAPGAVPTAGPPPPPQ